MDAVTLVIDFVESTALADRLEEHGPAGRESLGDLLGGYFGAVVDCIADWGGEVARLDGDAVQADRRRRPAIEGDLASRE
jgi:class 3 adenylate cyclase